LTEEQNQEGGAPAGRQVDQHFYIFWHEPGDEFCRLRITEPVEKLSARIFIRIPVGISNDYAIRSLRKLADEIEHLGSAVQ